MTTLKKILPLVALLALALPGSAFAAAKPKLHFSASAYAIPENTASLGTSTSNPHPGYADIKIVRSSKPSNTLNRSVSVRFSTSSSSANATAEYTPVTTTVAFPACNVDAAHCMSQTVSIPIIDDSVVGGPVVVNMKLSNPQGATLNYPSTAVLAIAEADTAGGGGGGGTPPPATIQFANANDIVQEPATGTTTATVWAIRSGDLSAAVSASYATANGTAIAGTDYSSTSGSVSFPSQATDMAGSIIQPIQVTLKSNPDTSPTRDFTVSLSSPSTGATLGSPSTDDVTILNGNGAPTVQFAASSFSTSENAGTVPVIVFVSGAINNELDVDYATSDGTGVAGTNYGTTADALSFAAGEVPQQEIDVPILDDGVFGKDTNFQVGLLNNADLVGGILGTPSTTTVTVHDSDPQPTAGVGPVTITRDGNGNVTVSGTVTISGPSATDTTVTLQVKDPTTGEVIGTITVTIPAGQTSANYTYTLTPAQLGNAGTLVVVLSGANGATVVPGGAGTSSSVQDVPAAPTDQVVLPVRQAADCGLTIKAAKAQRLLKQKGLKLGVRAAQSCQASISTTINKAAKKHSAQIVRALRFNGKKASFSLQAGKAKNVKVAFTKKTLASIKKALQARTKLVATVTVTTRDSASKVTRKTLKITIKR